MSFLNNRSFQLPPLCSLLRLNARCPLAVIAGLTRNLVAEVLSIYRSIAASMIF